jgi:hypothetical protein
MNFFCWSQCVRYKSFFMQGIFLFFFLFFLSPFAVRAATGTDVTNTILDWADSEIRDIHTNLKQAKSEYEAVCQDEVCFLYPDWKLSVLPRLELGLNDFQESAKLLSRSGNVCLGRDVAKIENRIGRLSGFSEFSLVHRPFDDTEDKIGGELKRVSVLVDILFFLRDALKEYGGVSEGNTDEEKQQFREIYQQKIEDMFSEKEWKDQDGTEGMPRDFQGIVFFDKAYAADSACVHPYNLGFFQVKEEWMILQEKLKEIQENFLDMENMTARFTTARESFFSEKNEEIRRQRARYRSKAWFQRNIEYPAENLGMVRVVWGASYITKSDEVRRQEDEDDEKRAKTLVKKEEPEPRNIREKDEFFTTLETVEEKYQDEVKYRISRGRSLRDATDRDSKISLTLDKDIIPLLLQMQKKNEAYAIAVQSLYDVCGSMPTCE